MAVSKDTIKEIARTNHAGVCGYKDGEEDAINYLVGCVLKATGGTVTVSEARAALDEHLIEQVVEVSLPYSDRYTTGEKIAEIGNIPDTQEALDTFKYCPQVEVTFEWNKDTGKLDPQYVTIEGDRYELYGR